MRTFTKERFKYFLTKLDKNKKLFKKLYKKVNRLTFVSEEHQHDIFNWSFEIFLV